jgi:hypothetical protein
MPERLAHFFSWIFQPLFMPLAGTLIFLNLSHYEFALMPAQVKWVVIFCNLLFTILLPGAFILLMRRFRLISSLSLGERTERPVPVFLTGIFYAFNLYYLYRLSNYLPAVYYLFLLSALVSVFISLLISAWWKISLHMTGIGGLCGALLMSSLIWQTDLRLHMALMFFIAGLVGSARLALNAHTPAQVGIGFLNGYLPQVLLLIFV